MYSSRKSGREAATPLQSNSAKAVEFDYLQKCLLKRQRTVRIYQPKSTSVLKGLLQFLRQNQPLSADLEMDGSETLVFALNALADYGKLNKLIVQSWTAYGNDIIDALQRCCELNKELESLIIRCRTNPDIIDRVLTTLPTSIKNLDISDNLINDTGPQFVQRIQSIITRNQLEEFRVRNCGLTRHTTRLFFDSFDSLGHLLTLNELTGVDFSQLNDIPEPVRLVMFPPKQPRHTTDNYYPLEYFKNKAFAKILIGANVRVWWPPTLDSNRKDFAGRFWPARVLQVDPVTLSFLVEYDNNERDQVPYSLVQPLNPFRYGGGAAIDLTIWKLPEGKKQKTSSQDFVAIAQTPKVQTRTKEEENRNEKDAAIVRTEPIRKRRGRPPNSAKRSLLSSATRAPIVNGTATTTDKDLESDADIESSELQNLSRKTDVTRNITTPKKIASLSPSKGKCKSLLVEPTKSRKKLPVGRKRVREQSVKEQNEKTNDSSSPPVKRRKRAVQPKIKLVKAAFRKASRNPALSESKAKLKPSRRISSTHVEVSKSSKCNTETPKRTKTRTESPAENMRRASTSTEIYNLMSSMKDSSNVYEFEEKVLGIPPDKIGVILWPGELCEMQEPNVLGVTIVDPSDFIVVVEEIHQEEPIYSIRFIFHDESQTQRVSSKDVRRTLFVNWRAWRDVVLSRLRNKSQHTSLSRPSNNTKKKRSASPVMQSGEGRKKNTRTSVRETSAKKRQRSMSNTSAQSGTKKSALQSKVEVSSLRLCESPHGETSLYQVPIGYYYQPQTVALDQGVTETPRRFPSELPRSDFFNFAMWTRSRQLGRDHSLLSSTLLTETTLTMSTERMKHDLEGLKQKVLLLTPFYNEALELREQFEQFRTKVEDIKKVLTCCICLDTPLSVLTLPCRHLATCTTCCARISMCPWCRTKITRQIEVANFSGDLKINIHRLLQFE